MFTARSVCLKIPTNCLRANMSSQKNNLDPRTEAFKKLVTPWEFWDESKRYRSMNLFSFESTSQIGILKMLQTPIDLRAEKLSAWWNRRKQENIVIYQSFDPERYEALGCDLSAGHAMLSIGASVLYKGKPWISGMPGTSNTKLPTHFEEGWILEAIDVSDCSIHYEGLINLQKAHNVHTLIAKNCPFFDNWCLDVTCSALLGLKNLDISGCQSVNPGGLSALTRLTNLQSLNLSNIPSFQTEEGALACLLLKHYRDNLQIEGVEIEEIVGSSKNTVNINTESLENIT